MIGWVSVFALALAAFGLAAFGLGMARRGWAVFAAILLIGLTGYAWQGSPTQPASPKAEQAQEPRSGDEMIAARKAWFDPTAVKSDYLTLSDGLARRGKFAQAAAELREGLRDNPKDMEGWLALGMALVAHADGHVTPAARYAYARARALDPANPAADLFLGVSFLQRGQVRAARDVWASRLEISPEDAPWRPGLQAEVERLDQMIANAPMLQNP